MEQIAGQFSPGRTPSSSWTVGARVAGGPAAQELLDDRRARRQRHPRRPAAPARPRQMGRRPRQGRPARVRAGAPGRRPSRTGDGRDWRSEEGHPRRRPPAPVHRHRRADRERRGRRLPHLRLPPRTRRRRSRALPAQVLDERPGPLRPGRRPRRCRLRHQAAAHPTDDRAHPGRGICGRMGGRRRGLRRQPAPARRPGAAAARLHARGLQHPPRPHPGQRSARRPPDQEDPQAGLAEAVRRTRCEGPPLVRLGPGRHHGPRPGRPSAPVASSQPPYQRITYYRCAARQRQGVCDPAPGAVGDRQRRSVPFDTYMRRESSR